MISPEIITKAKERAQNYISKSMIASFTLTNIVHTRIGSYNGYNTKKNKSINNYYFEHPREQSLKGLWRWWMRALFSGTALNDNQIKQKVDELLGSNNKPARFAIRLLVDNEIDSPTPIIDQKGLNDLLYAKGRRRDREATVNRLSLPSRLELSVMDKDLQQSDYKELLSVYHPNKLKLVIEVYLNAKNDYNNNKTDLDIIAIYSLVLAITFSGLGSITRRGFGKFAFEKITKSPDEITNAINHIRNSRTTQELEIELKKLIENAALVAERTCGSKQVTNLPMHPTLDSKGNCFKIKVVSPKNVTSDSKSVLYKIGRSTLKSEWKKRKFGNSPRALFRAGRDLHTWILGLPRYQSDSGYVSLTQYDNQDYYARRASAIFFSPHLSLDKKWYVIILGFKSLDWPKIIRHKPGPKSRTARPFDIILQNNNFSMYFEEAFTTVVEYLEKDSGSSSNSIGRRSGIKYDRRY